MIHKLLLFLILINADSAQLQNNKFQININNYQLKILNEILKKNDFDDIFQNYLESIVPDLKSETYKLTFRFQE